MVRWSSLCKELRTLRRRAQEGRPECWEGSPEEAAPSRSIASSVIVLLVAAEGMPATRAPVESSDEVSGQRGCCRDWVTEECGSARLGWKSVTRPWTDAWMDLATAS